MSDFDRLRPRSGPTPKSNGSVPGPRPDREGKRALFSVDAPPPTPSAARGALQLTCSGCGSVSALSPRQVIVAALPSLHLPILRRKFPSWMRCPACCSHQWVRVELRR
ncbi:hypothetical protein [Sporichthya sp.]|uniref:hypothetical protein n=1 Tax=Sporichthya sp. TaxID=65475 RepID=UPI0018190A92|nr:hypothetical protein [Sporichthya sp.]MBA3743052.1 hypothetical protein [Sporichthya sp.]